MAKYNYNDTVIFHLDNKDYKYYVHDAFIREHTGKNDAIFKALGMDEKAKVDFCSKAFGYKADHGLCPCCRYRDFEALSRLIEAIITECKKRNTYYKFDDYVIFTVDGKDYKYTVEDAWLSNTSGRNYEIFDVLGLDKEEFCSKAYGYPPESGSWPECHDRDLDALNRVIKALQEEITKRPVETVSIKTEDMIIFSGGKLSTPIEYKVKPEFLCTIVGTNNRLFKELEIDQPQSIAYCSKAYGYDAKIRGLGSWPEYKSNDYKVLPKLFDNLIADYGLTITINDKPYKGSKSKDATTYVEDPYDLEELKKLKNKLLLDKVPSMTKNLYYANLSRIESETPIIFTLKNKILHYAFTPTWLAIRNSHDGGNSTLFEELGISSIAKDLATACYGYTALSGAWPDYAANDKKALLRFLYVLSEEYYVKISIAGYPLTDFIDNEPFETTKANDATTYVKYPYDPKELETQATTLVDRSKLLNHRSPEISLIINHFSLKF